MTDRQRRWLTAVLVLGAVVLAMILIGFLAEIFYAFGDVILVFFLAWLLAFILSPVVAGLTRLVPVLPRIGAVVLVYATLVGTIVLVVVLVAGALAQSIAAFVTSVPQLRQNLPEILAPWQERVTALGLDQVDLLAQATSFLDNIATYAAQLAGPVQSLAVASFGALGVLLPLPDPHPRAVTGRGPRRAPSGGARGTADPGAARARARRRSGRDRRHGHARDVRLSR